jgi:hypothetical protein
MAADPVRLEASGAAPEPTGGRRSVGRKPVRGTLLAQRVRLLLKALRLRRESGMATAEYAVGTLAAVAFAVLLYRIATSPQVVAEMARIFTTAFHMVNPGSLHVAGSGH